MKKALLGISILLCACHPHKPNIVYRMYIGDTAHIEPGGYKSICLTNSGTILEKDSEEYHMYIYFIDTVMIRPGCCHVHLIEKMDQDGPVEPFRRIQKTRPNRFRRLGQADLDAIQKSDTPRFRGLFFNCQ